MDPAGHVHGPVVRLKAARIEKKDKVLVSQRRKSYYVRLLWRGPL